jgi:hypothetical protein
MHSSDAARALVAPAAPLCCATTCHPHPHTRRAFSLVVLRWKLQRRQELSTLLLHDAPSDPTTRRARRSRARAPDRMLLLWQVLSEPEPPWFATRARYAGTGRRTSE